MKFTKSKAVPSDVYCISPYHWKKFGLKCFSSSDVAPIWYSPFSFFELTIDTGHEESNPNILHASLAFDDVSSHKVWLQKVQ